ncbi:MAG: polyphosphate:AMP phosphotransferase [Oscillospiraceae bacterium]|nr:polyphosphate:AMP phosphotransferase [Oscillospiraceae bacterium]
MLENALKNKQEHFDYKDMTSQLQQTLSGLQLKIRDKKLPVIIIFEGWSASGKGSLIGEMIKYLDPRFFKVHSTLTASEPEKRYPLMKRFWDNIPEYGKMSVMDRSWYQELAISRMEEDISPEEYSRRINSVNCFERQLTDDGYLIIKLFLHISKDEQKKRFAKLREDDETKWRVTELDKKRHKHYDEYYEAFDDMLVKTNSPQAPWIVIEAADKTFTKYQMFNHIVSRITDALNGSRAALPASEDFPLLPMSALAEVSFEGKVIAREDYPAKLKKCQKELSKLHSRLYQAKIPLIIAFEGWDAAGKGGAIKRIASALDPRGYEAVPIAAPDRTELNHHYLWRFWKHLPKTGHIAIFDRTWYGRVMVEKLEGFTSPERCEQAYAEINEFEKELVESGAVIVKFWLHIDKDEQLRRFTERQNIPEKQWKITDEDWRNREKWDSYENAVNEMLRRTSTVYAPWNVIEANDKPFARIKTMDIIIDAVEKRLKEEKKKR